MEFFVSPLHTDNSLIFIPHLHTLAYFPLRSFSNLGFTTQFHHWETSLKKKKVSLMYQEVFLKVSLQLEKSRAAYQAWNSWYPKTPKLTRVHKCIYCVMGGHSKRVQWTFFDSLINALHMELFTVQTKSDEMFQNGMNFWWMEKNGFRQWCITILLSSCAGYKSIFG